MSEYYLLRLHLIEASIKRIRRNWQTW